MNIKKRIKITKTKMTNTKTTPYSTATPAL